MVFTASRRAKARQNLLHANFWALEAWQNQCSQGMKPNGLFLKKEFNALKKTNFPWIYDVTKYASQQPFIFLQTTFNNSLKSKQITLNLRRKDIMTVSILVMTIFN